MEHSTDLNFFHVIIYVQYCIELDTLINAQVTTLFELTVDRVQMLLNKNKLIYCIRVNGTNRIKTELKLKCWSCHCPYHI